MSAPGSWADAAKAKRLELSSDGGVWVTIQRTEGIDGPMIEIHLPYSHKVIRLDERHTAELGWAMTQFIGVSDEDFEAYRDEIVRSQGD